jgi:hypothetical protein
MKIFCFTIAAVISAILVFSCKKIDVPPSIKADKDVGPSIIPSSLRSDEVENTTKSVSELLDGTEQKDN